MIALPGNKVACAHERAGALFDICNGGRQSEIQRRLVERFAFERRFALREMANGRGDRLRGGDGVFVLLKHRSRNERVCRWTAHVRCKLPEKRTATFDQGGKGASRHTGLRSASLRALDDWREVKSDRPCGLIPDFAERVPVLDYLLGSARIERGDPACFKPQTAPRFEHLLSSRRERHDLVAGDPLRFEITVLERRPRFVTKLLDRHPKARHRDRIEGSVELPKPIVLKGSPLAILALRHIGDDRVKVEVGLLVAVGVVLEQADR